MFAAYKRYKAQVAPLYRNEIDRHLFATASFYRRDLGLEDKRPGRDRARGRWLGRWIRRKSEPAPADS